MASNKPTPCGPCQVGKVNTKADIWCYNCEEGLCPTCSVHHKRSKSSRDHKTIGIRSYELSTQTINTECNKHGQQLNLYCPSHLMPCCDECISTSHSKCTGINSLSSVVEKTKIEKSKEFLDKNIMSTLYILNEMVNNKSGNIKRGEQQVDSIKETIVKSRKKINEHLDDLEKRLCQQTDTVFSQEKSKASDLITEIENKKGKLNEMKDQLHAITSQSSKLESFLGVHQIEQQVHQCQRYVESLKIDERAREFDIKMQIENILSKLESLGEVMVVKTDLELNIETSVKRKAQVQSRDQSNINNLTMNIETKVEINMEKNVSDTISLMDGRFIVVECLGKVNLLTSDGKPQKQLPITGEAWSVTQINQNTIAISYPKEDIKIFNLENETVTKVITLSKACFGLSFSNNSLAVGLSKDEIRIIDLEGNTLKSIKVQSNNVLDHFVYCNDRVIYSDSTGKAVYCYDGSGKQIWQYTQDLSGPRGLCADTYGNIIVADWRSNRVIVISKDGQESKELIGEEGGLKDPQCIRFKNNDVSGLICDHKCSSVTRFNFSHE